MNPIVIDLKVNRDLLNANFDCYRVSMDPIVTYCEKLEKSVIEFKLRADDFSYLHVSMASQLNHLYCDPFCSQTVFFVSKSGEVVWTAIELMVGKLAKPKTVYSIPEYSEGLITLSFPDNELAIISDSNHSHPCILVLSTPSRSASEPWILLSKISLSDSQLNLKFPFQLVCSESTNLYNTSTQIDFILCAIDKKFNDNNDSNTEKNWCESSFISVLNWFTISGNSKESDSWTVKRTRKLIGFDWPKYVSFDFNGSPMLCVVSEKDFAFVYDSDKPVIQSSIECNAKINDKLLYTYFQSLEDISVSFKLPAHISKDDIFIEFMPTKLIIQIKGQIQLEGDLCDSIETNTSVWTLQQQQNYQLLQLTVSKSDKGMVWKEFIKGNKNCIEIENQDLLEETQHKLNNLTNNIPKVENDFNDDGYNPMGLEECDFVESSLRFNRFNGNTHTITHRIDLSGNQWLFTIPIKKSTNAENNELPYFVVRHDVDAIVCAPESCPDLNQFKVTHLATFAAIGYVQASKVNTRYIVSSNNFNFVVIADELRHLFVYKQPISIKSGEVRNRRTGKEVQTVANQHVINLTDCESIIGIQATNNSIFVLSTDRIFLIKL